MGFVRPQFRDRADAGSALAQSLGAFRASDVSVLGLARGGVPIARCVADALGADFGIAVSRKIGVPGIEEVALGAIAEGSQRVVADSVAWFIGVPSQVVQHLAARERVELERRASVYRAGAPLPDFRGRTVILVDDGLATGASMRAAARAIRDQHPRRLIAAVPVASRSGVREMRWEVDELIALVTPERFETVAAMYEDFTPVTDEDVLHLAGVPASLSGRRIVSDVMHDVSERIAASFLRPHAIRVDRERTIEIPVDGDSIIADLGAPHEATWMSDRSTSDRVRGLAILAHGGGSSRNSYRNRYLAGRLRLAGYTTLRVDLLTAEEQRIGGDGANVGFDLARSTARLAAVCAWAARTGIEGAGRTILLGASVGAAAALATAARCPADVHVAAVVARGGRVDLAAHMLADVQVPVLLVVGGADRDTLARNTDALRSLGSRARLIRVPGAGHTFGEPGALGAVAEQTVKWLDELERPSWPASRREATSLEASRWPS